MYKKLLDLYPGIDPQTICNFEGFRIRYYFDDVKEFKLFNNDDGELTKNNIQNLKTFIGKILKDFSKGEKLNCSIICCLGEKKEINKSFLTKNYPSEIKSLFHIKDGEIIHNDDMYYIVFDINDIKPNDIYNIIKYTIEADFDVLNTGGKHIGIVYFYPPSMDRLLNLYDDRGMDICYRRPEDYFNNDR